MVKILQSTSRGQITLPKEWRDSFSTNYYKVEVKGKELTIVPLMEIDTLNQDIENAWDEYNDGKVITHEQLIKKYGL